MKIKPLWLVILITLVLQLAACDRYGEVEIKNLDKRVGYVASEVVTPAALKIFQLSSPKRITNAGKIVATERFLLIAEEKKGIHVFDNRAPTDPKAIAFISIPAITDFLYKQNTLIVSNGDDLVALNVTALNEILDRGRSPEAVAANPSLFSEVKRLEKVFTYPNFPEQRGTYFECPDSLVFITEWTLDSNFVNPTCYR